MSGDALDPKSVAALAARYLEHLTMTRGLSRESKKSTRLRLARFASYLDERGIGRPIEVTKEVLEQYQRSVFHHRRADGRALRRTTQNQYVIVVRTFFRCVIAQA
jgi:integrase/recombinase XerD